jgi:uncharacterized protein
MSDATLKRAAALILRSGILGSTPTVLWHAGEPLALGMRRFAEAVDIVERNNIYARPLKFSVQTNATLINQAWCDFLKRYSFHVGVSVDGPQHLHDTNRIGWTGKGSFSKAVRGIDLLRNNRIPFVGICVLTDRSLDFPDEIFDFFVNAGFRSFGFNSEEIEAAHKRSSLLRDNNSSEFSQALDRYKAFMTRIIERWRDAAGAIYVRELEYLSSKVVLGRTCQSFTPMQDVAKGLKIITVRTDGSLVTYSPELASGTPENPDEFVVGHIDRLEELEDIFADARYLRMRAAISSGIAKCRASCKHFDVCGGGWPSNKYFENGTFDCSETLNCRLHIQALTECLAQHFTSLPEFDAAVESYVASKVSSRPVSDVAELLPV